jgi:dTMP kinase
MALLFTMDRIAHNKEIDKALEEGKIVICDRYYYSSLAYQGSLCDYEWVWHMNCRCPEIRHPDLCIFLDLAPKDALARISKRGEAKEIYETEERLSMFRDAFHRVFVSLRDRVEIINAAPAPSVIAERVLVHVKKVLAKKSKDKKVKEV